MKNLSNCTPSEFLKQTVKIKKAVEKWLTITDLLNIRKNLPKLEEISSEMSTEEAEKVTAENKRRRAEQMRANLSRMIDVIAEEHPAETLELLALVCFVPPKDVDKYMMSEYLEAITDMITDKAVVGFFTSLERLGQMRI
jgi:hypothetical protein